VYAIGIDRARPCIRQEAVPDLVRVFGQFDPFDLTLAAMVEQAEFDLAGVAREQCEIDPAPRPRGAEGEGLAFADA